MNPKKTSNNPFHSFKNWQWDIIGSVGGVISAVVAVISLYGQFHTPPTSPSTSSRPQAKLQTAHVVIDGSGLQVDILRGEKGAAATDGHISGSGTSTVLFLPLGQEMQITASGSGTNIRIKREIMPYVHINDSGSGTEISAL